MLLLVHVIIIRCLVLYYSAQASSSLKTVIVKQEPKTPTSVLAHSSPTRLLPMSATSSSNTIAAPLVPSTVTATKPVGQVTSAIAAQPSTITGRTAPLSKMSLLGTAKTAKLSIPPLVSAVKQKPLLSSIKSASPIKSTSPVKSSLSQTATARSTAGQSLMGSVTTTSAAGLIRSMATTTASSSLTPSSTVLNLLGSLQSEQLRQLISNKEVLQALTQSSATSKLPTATNKPQTSQPAHILQLSASPTVTTSTGKSNLVQPKLAPTQTTLKVNSPLLSTSPSVTLSGKSIFSPTKITQPSQAAVAISFTSSPSHILGTKYVAVASPTQPQQALRFASPHSSNSLPAMLVKTQSTKLQSSPSVTPILSVTKPTSPSTASLATVRSMTTGTYIPKRTLSTTPPKSFTSSISPNTSEISFSAPASGLTPLPPTSLTSNSLVQPSIPLSSNPYLQNLSKSQFPTISNPVGYVTSSAVPSTHTASSSINQLTSQGAASVFTANLHGSLLHKKLPTDK